MTVAARKIINDRYELDALPLARGGMGEVWTGRDVKLERDVAVKFIRFPEAGSDQELIQRFVRESRLTARLEHPGVPTIYDVGTHDGRPYLVMQRVQGISVADLIAEQGPLPVGWAAAITAQTCAVLVAAHAASLVHRDLKPANLMLDPHGGVKVLDFGLAVAMDGADGSRLTRTGQVLGTPAYMAPEQVLTGVSSPASDLYALGCTLHEMLCGQPLFTGSTAFAVMNRQVQDRPTPVRSSRADAPAEVEELLLHLLRKRPEDRPADAQQVYERILPYAVGLGDLPGVLNRPTVPSPPRMYARVLHRLFTTAKTSTFQQASGRPEPTPAGAPDRAAGHPPSFGRSDLDRARAEAHRLVGEGRFSQAGEVLTAVLAPATRALGSVDGDVVSLRMEHADVVFQAGNHRQALAVYEELVTDLAPRMTGTHESVLHCRLRMATCLALLGRITEALELLRGLRADETEIFGPDHPRVYELRRQIGLLQLGAGDRAEATRTLTELQHDLERSLGADHQIVDEIRRLIATIPS